MELKTTVEHYYAVIMAGGGGTRLWPLSRRSRPKQMLKLAGDRTLFQMAVDRLSGLLPPERILVVTVAEQAAELQMECDMIPPENYLIEPMPRGTASVVGLAAVAIRNRDPHGVMVVLTADHFIQNVAGFQAILRSAYTLAQEGELVTLGITPTHPATGYGYIQQGEKLGDFLGLPAYRVKRFKEKPDEAHARQMVSQGDHVWNSGMFIWRVDRILGEINRLMPELDARLELIAAAWATDRRDEVLDSIWPTIKPETIDYGIMEKAEQVAVLPAPDLAWNDVGSWDSLFDVLPEDEQGNIIIRANHLGLDTKGALVCAENSGRLIVTIGVHDLIVVDTGDVLLVCPREDAQRVRSLVNLLKEKDYEQYV